MYFTKIGIPILYRPRVVFDVLTTKSRTERQPKSKFEVQFQQNSCLIDSRKTDD